MRFLAALLLALLLAGGAQAQDALPVATCGTLPLAYKPGVSSRVTVDLNGNLCIAGTITASATTVVSAIAALPTLAPGNQTPTASLAGAAYAQPVFGSAAGGGTQVDATHGLPVNIVGGGGSGGTASSYGAAFPATGTAAGFSDGTNMQGARVFDLDSGAGTEYSQGLSIRLSSSGGSVEGGTSSNPLRIDPTGATPQPITAAALPLLSDSTVSGSLSAPGTVVLNTQGSAAAIFMISGTGAGLAGTFQGQVSGSATWIAVPSMFQGGAGSMPAIAAPASNFASGNGTYVVNSAGFAQVRLNLTAISSGTLTALGEASAGQQLGFGINYLAGSNSLLAGVANPSSIGDGTALGNSLQVVATPYLYNGTNQDRMRSVQALGDGVAGIGMTAVGNWGWNGTTWDRLKSTGGALNINAATLPLPSNAAIETGGNLASIATNTTGAAKDSSLTTIDTDIKATQPRNVSQIAGTAPTMKASGANAATTDTALVVAPSPNPSTVCGSVKPINQTSSTDLITSTGKLHICSIVLISAAAQNLSLVEGTGSVCATGIAALIGGTTASLAVAANGGFSAVSERAWLETQTTADHLCLLQSGAGNVSGVITFTDHN